MKLTKDVLGALGMSLFFFIILATNYRFPFIVQALSSIGRPAASIFILGTIVVLYYNNLHLTSLITAILAYYLLIYIWKTWPQSIEKEVYLDIGKDQSRFEEQNSIDLQFANKSVGFDAPQMVLKPVPFPELLVFPPSSATLHEMCG
jgi:hypothetical protein